jgi:hypothetical protein
MSRTGRSVVLGAAIRSGSVNHADRESITAIAVRKLDMLRFDTRTFGTKMCFDSKALSHLREIEQIREGQLKPPAYAKEN